MPVAVRIDFTPPDHPDLTALRIFESVDKDGPFNQIERVTDLGAYPNFISYYITELATAANNWFAIQWEYPEGAVSPLYTQGRGGTTVVAEVKSRILLRDPSVDEEIAQQEAEAVVSDYFNTDDEYSILTATSSELSGLTLLALARANLFIVLKNSQTEEYTSGLVSQRSGNSQNSMKLVRDLIAEANRLLGRNFSIVRIMEELEISGGLVAPGTPQDGQPSLDQTRLIFELP